MEMQAIFPKNRDLFYEAHRSTFPHASMQTANTYLLLPHQLSAHRDESACSQASGQRLGFRASDLGFRGEFRGSTVWVVFGFSVEAFGFRVLPPKAPSQGSGLRQCALDPEPPPPRAN